MKTAEQTAYRDFIKNVSALYNPQFAKKYSKLFRSQLRPENCFNPLLALRGFSGIDRADDKKQVFTLNGRWYSAIALLFSGIDEKNIGWVIGGLKYVWKCLQKNNVDFIYFLNFQNRFLGCYIYKLNDNYFIANSDDYTDLCKRDKKYLKYRAIVNDRFVYPVNRVNTGINHHSEIKPAKTIHELLLEMKNFIYFNETDTKSVAGLNFRNPFKDILKNDAENISFENCYSLINHCMKMNVDTDKKPIPFKNMTELAVVLNISRPTLDKRIKNLPENDRQTVTDYKYSPKIRFISFKLFEILKNMKTSL